MARVQAAKAFFSSGRAPGCKTGHPSAVLQGLLLPLRQLPNDLSQGEGNERKHDSLEHMHGWLRFQTGHVQEQSAAAKQFPLEHTCQIIPFDC